LSHLALELLSDPTDAPTVRADGLNPLNTRFGRRFEIISFRWLSPQEV